MKKASVQGALQDFAGKVQDATGGLTGNARTQLEGMTRQLAGQAQGAYGEALDQARDATQAVGRSVRQQPMAALLIAVAVGYGIAWLTLPR